MGWFGLTGGDGQVGGCISYGKEKEPAKCPRCGGNLIQDSFGFKCLRCERSF